MGQDCPPQKHGAGNTITRTKGGGEGNDRIRECGAIRSKNTEYDSSSDTLCMENSRRADMAHKICSEIRKVPVKIPKEESLKEEIWVRQSFEASRVHKEALQLETEIVNGTKLDEDLELQGDKDLSISEGLLETDRDESVIGLLKTTKSEFEFGLFFLKLFDFLFDLNVIGLGFLCFHISYKFEISRVS